MLTAALCTYVAGVVVALGGHARDIDVAVHAGRAALVVAGVLALLACV